MKRKIFSRNASVDALSIHQPVLIRFQLLQRMGVDEMGKSFCSTRPTSLEECGALFYPLVCVAQANSAGNK
jgi:hypothetical protein